MDDVYSNVQTSRVSISIYPFLWTLSTCNVYCFLAAASCSTRRMRTLVVH